MQAINHTPVTNGQASAVCCICGQHSPLVSIDDYDEPDMWQLPQGWSQGPYPADYQHRDGSTGSIYTCSTCNERAARGETLQRRIYLRPQESEKQTYILGPQGSGTTTIAERMQARGDGRPVILEWDGKTRIFGDAIVTSNIPKSECDLPAGAQLIEIKHSKVESTADPRILYRFPYDTQPSCLTRSQFVSVFGEEAYNRLAGISEVDIWASAALSAEAPPFSKAQESWKQDAEQLHRLAQKDGPSVRRFAGASAASSPSTRWARIGSALHLFLRQVASALGLARTFQQGRQQ